MIGVVWWILTGLVLEVRDAWTGRVVEAAVWVKVEGKSERISQGGQVVLEVPADSVWVTHSLYKPLGFVPPENVSHVRVWLSPSYPPVLPSPIPGQVRVVGSVVDPGGHPIQGVQVTFPNGVVAFTDPDGIFRGNFPSRGITLVDPTTWPRKLLRFEKPGYMTVLREVIPIEGVLWLRIELSPGSGVARIQDLHGQGTGAFHSSPPQPYGQKADTLRPPAVIRVGTNCTGRSCSFVQIMSLETYVRGGLDEEWIASWPAHSLRAGSVAYRTYGAYYTAHPISANYDICNNTYCQVWDGSDVYASVVDAVNHTQGILLSDGGGYAFSEYSAENNNCGCGDGYAGTGTTWPCIADTVCAGHSCFGHGRGMCQWGTQRWATDGKTWKWMADHYYNPGGFTLSSPIRMVGVEASPDTVSPGDTLLLSYTLEGMMEDSLPHGMLGASLYRPTDGYVSDPSRDTVVRFLAGYQTLTRRFILPDSLPNGMWEVLFGVWLDINEDGVIQAGDLPLQLARNLFVVVQSPTQVEEDQTSKKKNVRFHILPGMIVVESRVQTQGVVMDVQGRVVRRLILQPFSVQRIQLPRGVYQIQFETGDARKVWVP